MTYYVKYTYAIPGYIRQIETQLPTAPRDFQNSRRDSLGNELINNVPLYNLLIIKQDCQIGSDLIDRTLPFTLYPL